MATDETKTRIIEAAGPIFADQGFRDATVREICDAAGVGLASVNYHFRDKQQLYEHVVEFAFDHLVLRPPLQTAWPPGTPAEIRLRAWIERLAQRILALPKDSWQDRLLTREIQSPTPACQDVLRKRIDSELSPLLAILDDVLPPNTSAAELQRLGLCIVGQVLIYDTHRDLARLLLADAGDTGESDVARVAECATRFSLAALGLAPPLGCTFADGGR